MGWESNRKELRIDENGKEKIQVLKSEYMENTHQNVRDNMQVKKKTPYGMEGLTCVGHCCITFWEHRSEHKTPTAI